MKRSNGALDKASAALTSYISAHRLLSGDELPPTAKLAADAGVSFVTMWKALSELKKQGGLTGVTGHPFRIASPRGEETRPTQKVRIPRLDEGAQSTAWRRLYRRIETDILDGVLRPGATLPSVKELAANYGVCYATLRKALDALASSGSIEHRGKKRAIAPFAGPKRHSRIICLTRSYDSFTMSLAQHDEEVFRTLEKECMNAHLSLDVFLICFEFLDSFHGAAEPQRSPSQRPWRYYLREFRTGQKHALEDLGKLGGLPALGYILIAWGGYQDLEKRLLPILANMKTSVAILAESVHWSHSPELNRTRALRLFTITASLEPARTVARYLLGYGHRRIAFISPYHQFIWSQKRLEGIESIYSRDASGIATAYIRESKKTNVSSAHVRKELRPLMEQAFADIAKNGTTAWVMVNDQCAFMALQFLAEKGVKTPSELSVISFDDTIDALRVNLTSYNFNAAAVATAILGHLLNRKPYALKDGDEIDEIRGYLAERQTVAHAGMLGDRD